MKVIEARNVHEALPLALDYLFNNAIPRSSRNGPVLVAPTPVATVYRSPRERVLFWEERDANPFFHFFEALWMLAGRNDLAFLQQFVQRMALFSDDGISFHGAYGYRWRRHFAVQQWCLEYGMEDGDQLRLIADRLRVDATDRRQVLQIWDARCDLIGLQNEKRDLPCNTQAYFQRDVNGRLDLFVTNRSNDIIWGCYGANAVHFSMLQEYVANRIGCEVGIYHQVSFNWHGYLATLQPLEPLTDHVNRVLEGGTIPNPYLCNIFPEVITVKEGSVLPFPQIVDLPVQAWDRELQLFLENPSREDLDSAFLHQVARPLAMAHIGYKTLTGEPRYKEALDWIAHCQALDWNRAARQWIQRRYARWQAKHVQKPTKPEQSSSE